MPYLNPGPPGTSQAERLERMRQQGANMRAGAGGGGSSRGAVASRQGGMKRLADKNEFDTKQERQRLLDTIANSDKGITMLMQQHEKQLDAGIKGTGVADAINQAVKKRQGYVDELSGVHYTERSGAGFAIGTAMSQMPSAATLAGDKEREVLGVRAPHEAAKRRGEATVKGIGEFGETARAAGGALMKTFGPEGDKTRAQTEKLRAETGQIGKPKPTTPSWKVSYNPDSEQWEYVDLNSGNWSGKKAAPPLSAELSDAELRTMILRDLMEKNDIVSRKGRNIPFSDIPESEQTAMVDKAMRAAGRKMEPRIRQRGGAKKIKVKRKVDGEPGTIPEGEFDPDIYERR